CPGLGLEGGALAGVCRQQGPLQPRLGLFQRQNRREVRGHLPLFEEINVLEGEVGKVFLPKSLDELEMGWIFRTRRRQRQDESTQNNEKEDRAFHAGTILGRGPEPREERRGPTFVPMPGNWAVGPPSLASYPV